MNKDRLVTPVISSWMIWVQCICFSVLYAIWALPETILIRHVCLIMGAFLSLWIIYQYRYSFFQRSAIPIWLIIALFMWATFHLFFLSNDFDAQYAEYTSIWKRTAIGAIFALGFGIALSSHSQKISLEGKALWVLMYLGLITPTLIYIFKFVLTRKAELWGVEVSEFWKLQYGTHPFYSPKTTYVCFCLPTLGIALGQLARNLGNHQIYKWANIIYLATIPAILFVFYGENIKNGVVYSVVLATFFIGIIVFRNFRQDWLIKLVLLGFISLVCAFFLIKGVQNNTSWRTLIADVKIAKDTETYQHWKYNGERGLPINDLGVEVSGTNYERFAWAKIGAQLIIQNPLGYGLIERSFGGLAKINWPDSKLHQSHSGWIDLTLGLGIPGILLILISFSILLYQLISSDISPKLIQSHYHVTAWWALLTLLIIWCTTEISQKVYFDDLIFWLTLAVGMRLGNSHDSILAKQELSKL